MAFSMKALQQLMAAQQDGVGIGNIGAHFEIGRGKSLQPASSDVVEGANLVHSPQSVRRFERPGMV